MNALSLESQILALTNEVQVLRHKLRNMEDAAYRLSESRWVLEQQFTFLRRAAQRVIANGKAKPLDFGVLNAAELSDPPVEKGGAR